MTTTPEQIDLWRQSATEKPRLEFKEAKTQFDNRKLYEYCVGIANEGGGYLLLGVADRSPRPVVETQAFHDPIGMAEKLLQAVGFRVDIEEVAHPNGRVLVFHIPSRPRGPAYHLDGKYPMRSGESLVRQRFRLPEASERLSGHCGDGGGRSDQARRPGRGIAEVRPVRALLGVKLI